MCRRQTCAPQLEEVVTALAAPPPSDKSAVVSSCDVPLTLAMNAEKVVSQRFWSHPVEQVAVNSVAAA